MELKYAYLVQRLKSQAGIEVHRVQLLHVTLASHNGALDQQMAAPLQIQLSTNALGKALEDDTVGGPLPLTRDPY